MLDELSSAGPTIIDQSALGPQGIDGIAQFWEWHADTPWCKEHPVMTLSPADRQWCLPMELFGDDASIWRHEKLLVLSWRSALWQSSRTWWTMFIITVVPLALAIPDQTLSDVHEVIRWSFAACFSGSYPRRTHTGALMKRKHGRRRYIRRGSKIIFRGALCRLTGDYKYLAETYELRGYSNTSCCHRCRATKTGDLLYTEVGPRARWHNYPRNHQDFVQELRESSPATPLTKIPGWHLSMLKTDLMHNFFLGTCLHLLASTLVDLCRDGWFGGFARSRAAQLSTAYIRFRRWQKAQKLQASVGRFTATTVNWRAAHVFPEWSSTVKAHNARILVAWLETEATAQALAALADRANRPAHKVERARLRAQAMYLAALYAYEMDTQPRDRKMLPAEAERVAGVGYKFLKTYMRLARQALEQRECLFATKPKMHQRAR